MEGESHIVCNVIGRTDQRDGFLNASICEAIVDDVPVVLSLSSKAERFEERIVEWTSDGDLGDPQVDVIENHSRGLACVTGGTLQSEGAPGERGERLAIPGNIARPASNIFNRRRDSKSDWA